MLDFHYEVVGEDADIISVPLSGRLTAENCEYLLGCVENQIRNGYTRLILNCDELTYISSMGLGMLVRVNSRMKKIGGDVKLSNLHGVVADTIKLVGLHRVFQLYSTVEAAVAAYGDRS